MKSILSVDVEDWFHILDLPSLAWQRQWRYRKCCELYLYDRQAIERLFAGRNLKKVEIEPISRDFFVTAYA